jgi:hypothetical protein
MMGSYRVVDHAGPAIRVPDRLESLSGFSDAGMRPALSCSVKEFAQFFCRNADGSWTCISAGTFSGPSGRIQVTPGSTFYPGTMFMGFDLAAWLDASLDGETTECAPSHGSERSSNSSRP